MGFHEDLSAKVYELVQVAWVGYAYQSEDDRGIIEAFFETPQCDPQRVWEAYEPFFNTDDPQFGDPVPQRLLAAAQELYEAQFKHFEGISGSLEEWSGDAAMSFKRRIEDLWWSVAKQQRTIEELAALYKGYQELIKGTQLDIMTIATATVDAMTGYREQKSRQERAANMVAASMLVAAIVTVATAGIALPATAAGAATTAVLATTVVSVTKTIVEGTMQMNALRRVEGDNPDEIINSMFTAINGLLEDTQWTPLSRACGKHGG